MRSLDRDELAFVFVEVVLLLEIPHQEGETGCIPLVRDETVFRASDHTEVIVCLLERGTVLEELTDVRFRDRRHC